MTVKFRGNFYAGPVNIFVILTLTLTLQWYWCVQMMKFAISAGVRADACSIGTLNIQNTVWMIVTCQMYLFVPAIYHSFTRHVLLSLVHGPLARYVKLWVAHVPGTPGTFSPPLWVSDSGKHHGTCVTHVPWCMPESQTSGFLWSRWWGKRSRHSWRMRNPQFLRIW